MRQIAAYREDQGAHRTAEDLSAARSLVRNQSNLWGDRLVGLSRQERGLKTLRGLQQAQAERPVLITRVEEQQADHQKMPSVPLAHSQRDKPSTSPESAPSPACLFQTAGQTRLSPPSQALNPEQRQTAQPRD